MSQPSKTPPEANPRRWLALVVIALAQLMVVLDATIVNIALPSAQKALRHLRRRPAVGHHRLHPGLRRPAAARRPDRRLFGRKRTFLIGLVGFAGASALGGAAAGLGHAVRRPRPAGRLRARCSPPPRSSLLDHDLHRPQGARQGVRHLRRDRRRRRRDRPASLGGLLTEYLDWRWCLYVNVPIAVVAAVGAVPYCSRPTPAHAPARLDVPGVRARLRRAGGRSSTASAEAEPRGWTRRLVLGAARRRRRAARRLRRWWSASARAPLLPLRIVRDRNRGGAFLAIGLAVIGMFGAVPVPDLLPAGRPGLLAAARPAWPSCR